MLKNFLLEMGTGLMLWCCCNKKYLVLPLAMGFYTLTQKYDYNQTEAQNNDSYILAPKKQPCFKMASTFDLRVLASSLIQVKIKGCGEWYR